MPLDPSLAGRTYPPTTYLVGAEKVREFADAIGDPHPAFRDPAAAKALGHPDVIAPPTFATVLTLRAAEQALSGDEVGVDFSHVVHGEERYAYTRPIRAGDLLVSTVTIDSVRSAGGHFMVTLRAEVATEGGEHVLTATSMLVVRGEAAA